MLAPAGTPPAIIDTMNKAIAQALSDEEFLKELRLNTVEPLIGSTPASTGRFVNGELKKWADLVKSTGIRME